MLEQCAGDDQIVDLVAYRYKGLDYEPQRAVRDGLAYCPRLIKSLLWSGFAEDWRR